MANLGGVFDANAKENQAPANVVPAGEYTVIAVKSEVKDTSDKSGRYLNFEFQITKGECQNRRIFHKFNLWLSPDKEKAIAIGKGQFSEFCRAAGVLTPSDSSELHNRPVLVKVSVKDSPGYGPQNNVQSFKPIQQNAPLVTPSAAAGASW